LSITDSHSGDLGVVVMDFDEIAVAVEQIRRARTRKTKSAHQPATLIWAAKRASQGESRVAPWRDVRAQLIEIIAAVGDNVDDVTVAERVLGLGNSPLVDFGFSTSVFPASDEHPNHWLDERNPSLGLAEGVYQTLAVRGNFEKFAELVVGGLPDLQGRLIREYFGVFAGFGEVPGFPVGAMFKDRAEMAKLSVHRNGQAGIVGTQERGAESIVVSGGYEDDEDYGDVIVYTGHGGRDQNSGRQISDQSFSASGNAALVTSHVNQAPVRVFRRSGSGYQYDGLFRVEKYWSERGRSGFQVCRYRLVKFGGNPDLLEAAVLPSGSVALPSGSVAPGRTTTTVDRLLRSRALARAVKELHEHRCQLCEVRLVIAGRGYAEGAHIRPLGRPHVGTDTSDNLLCLCPNCHVLFDNGEILIGDDLEIRSAHPHRGVLREVGGHQINVGNLGYHRRMFSGM
jgi:predicted restriction endonuclease